ncbi:hypothetical protein PSPO_a0271 [Pseudoalteromonas spongiae UST010723-006]|nr:hypothetical protein PSPO_a0271 [Pseudoalteromonas spongiae UST010723-006]
MSNLTPQKRLKAAKSVKQQWLSAATDLTKKKLKLRYNRPQVQGTCSH